MINLCFDKLLSDQQHYPWPNLIHSDNNYTEQSLINQRSSWSTTSPWVDFPRIVDYLKDESVAHNIFSVEQAPEGSLYLVNICWFDHNIDYFSLMSELAQHRLRRREIKFVVIYGEADSGLEIQKTLFRLCNRHSVNPIDVHVILGNSMADIIPNFHFFDDDEIIFQRSQTNYFAKKLEWHDQPRSQKMTLLSRVHKSWRAYFCSWYWQHGFHNDSYFSYRMIDHGEDMDPNTNPLNHTIKYNAQHQKTVGDFLKQAPYSADNLKDSEHNFYGTRVDSHYQDSYWNCVLETHLSLSQNMPGVFITEKTWKAIAHAQPFVILGTAESLQHLRKQGYRTFGEIGFDETYDCILDPTERFRMVFEQVKKIHALTHEDLLKLNRAIRPIVEHNQKLYWSSKKEKLEKLFYEIQGSNL
jgi:hypothetical protein